MDFSKAHRVEKDYLHISFSTDDPDRDQFEGIPHVLLVPVKTTHQGDGYDEEGNEAWVLSSILYELKPSLESEIVRMLSSAQTVAEKEALLDLAERAGILRCCDTGCGAMIHEHETTCPGCGAEDRP